MTRIVLVALAVGALAIGAVVVSAQGADEGWRVTVRFEYAPDYGIGIYSYHHGDGVFRSAENPVTGEFYFAPNDNGVITAVRTFTIPAPDAPPADDSAIRELRAERARLTTALDAANAELITARAQRDTFERERDAARSESDTLKGQLATARQELITVRAERDEAREQVRILTAQLAVAPTPTPEPVARAPHISCSSLYEAALDRTRAAQVDDPRGVDRALVTYHAPGRLAGYAFTFLGGRPIAENGDGKGHFHTVLGCHRANLTPRWTCEELGDDIAAIVPYAKRQVAAVTYIYQDRQRPFASQYALVPASEPLGADGRPTNPAHGDRVWSWPQRDREGYLHSLPHALKAISNAACSAAR